MKLKTTPARELIRERITNELASLAVRAFQQGMVVRVTRTSSPPLAMGRADTYISVEDSNAYYRNPDNIEP